MTERKGSLMNWRADCGHSMVVYSLEPTPTACPDCVEKTRKTITRSFNCHSTFHVDGPTDLDDWLSDAKLGELPEGLVTALSLACADYSRAVALADEADDACRDAWYAVDKALDQYAPPVERLSMPEAVSL